MPVIKKMSNAITTNLADQQQALEKAIRDRPDDNSLYARLSSLLVEQQKPVSPEIERRGLEYYIEQHPDRSDLRRRLCFLRLQQREHLTEDEIEGAFPEYIGAGQVHSFLEPLYRAAYDDGEAGHLDLPTRVMHRHFPNCPCCLYFRASYVFHFRNAHEALALLEAGRTLCETYDYLASLYVDLLHCNDRHDQAKAFVRDFFRTYTGDLWRAPNFLTLRAEATKRGLPPILIVTLPKSGSVFLLNTLSRGLSVPFTYLCPLGLYFDLVIDERVRDFAAGGALAVDHLVANEHNLGALSRHGIRKIVFHYRDIRQSSLSFVHHSGSDEIVSEPRNVVLSRRHRLRTESGTFEGVYWNLFSDWLPFLQGWTECIANDDRFEFLITNFDDLAAEADLIGRILKFHDIPRDAFDWSVLDSPKEDRAGHFRRGLRDEWRQVLSEELQAEVERTLRARPVLSRLDVMASAGRRGSNGSHQP